MTDDVDALFDLPADEFVAARDDVVKGLKAAGDAEQAAAVKSLRRPSLAAWSVNQVVRADPDAFAALVAAGRTMQKAQRRALSGVRDSGLRDASTARRGLVESLAHHAERVLEEAGARPASHLDDVVATFEAASADPDAAATIGAGRLSAPVHVTTDFSGTSALLAMSSAPAPDNAPDDAADTPDQDPGRAERRRAAIKALEAARRRAEASAAAAQAAREEARALATTAVDARRTADEARAAAERAAAEADDVAQQAATAEEAAATATTTAEADADAVEDARTTLDELD